MKAGSGFAAFLGIERNIALLLAAICSDRPRGGNVDAIRAEVSRGTGASVSLIGLFDVLKTLLGAVYAYPGRGGGGQVGSSRGAAHVYCRFHRRLHRAGCVPASGGGDRRDVPVSRLDVFLSSGELFFSRSEPSRRNTRWESAFSR